MTNMWDRAFDQATPVEVKRRRLRSALRSARERAGLTQKNVADALGLSLSKIVRAELGTSAISPADVRALLSLFGESDQRVVDDLVHLAHAAREPSQWTPFADVYTETSLDLFATERSAALIAKYEPDQVPGLLQTEDYARALLCSLGNSEPQVRRKLEVRVARQQLFELERPPKLNFVLGEAVVRTPPTAGAKGGFQIMEEQLEHLLSFAQRPGIDLYVLPFASGLHQSSGESFTILHFEDDALEDLLYLEDPGRVGTVTDDPSRVQHYLDRHADLRVDRQAA